MYTAPLIFSFALSIIHMQWIFDMHTSNLMPDAVPRSMVLTESELSGSPVLLYNIGLEISIEEANYTIQEDTASSLLSCPADWQCYC